MSMTGGSARDRPQEKRVANGRTGTSDTESPTISPDTPPDQLQGAM